MPMFTRDQLENILFLDIETVCLVEDYHELSPRMMELWDRKAIRLARPEEEKGPEELFWEKGGIYAEFGKVVCISCGYLRFGADGMPMLKLKSFFDRDEKTLLAAFGQALNKFTSAKPSLMLCAHNGKEFDFPYMGRRFLINHIALPYALRVQGKKPWETPFIDTMELWKFGDFKSYTSLDLLAAVFGIPSSKDDIDGSQVSSVFWQEDDLERIKVYCEKDVLVTAQVLLNMCGENMVPDDRVELG